MLEIWVQVGGNKSSRSLLCALNQAIRVIIFQVITCETEAVTAEARDEGPRFDPEAARKGKPSMVPSTIVIPREGSFALAFLGRVRRVHDPVFSAADQGIGARTGAAQDTRQRHCSRSYKLTVLKSREASIPGGLTFVRGEVVAQSFAHTLVEEHAHLCLGGQQLLSFFQRGDGHLA